MDVTLPDGAVVQGVPEGTTKEQLLSKLMKAGHPSAAALAGKIGLDQTIKESSGLDKFNAGAGLAFTNIGRAAKQMVGVDSEYQDNKGMDKALTGTGAGLAGNVAGNVAAFAPAAVIPGANTVAGAAALGGITAAMQPSEGVVDRLKNMGEGAALGGLVQGVARYPVEIADAVKSLGRGLKSTVEPFYQGGRDQILARALRGATGGNPETAKNLLNASEIVPGSAPTAAEVGKSPGLAALQRSAAATNPESYATRATQQNEARIAELSSLTGNEAQKRAADVARNAAAKPHYDAAFGSTIVGLPPQLQTQIDDLAKRPAVKAAISEALTKAANEGIDLGGNAFSSVKGMHYVKRAIDDQIANAAPDDARILKKLQESFLGAVDTISPEYAAGRQAYAAASKPINQMDVAQAISDKAVNKLTGALKPQQFANALTDDTAAAATGFGKATLENTLEPAQLSRLNAIKEDLANSVYARDAGRGAGSDTVQKLAMSNMMQRSGMPEGVLNLPVLGRFGSWAYAHADEKMKRQLAEALLDPKQAGALLSKAELPALAGATDARLGEKASALSRALLLPSLPYALRPSN